jgi:hypothetical protein
VRVLLAAQADLVGRSVIDSMAQVWGAALGDAACEGEPLPAFLLHHTSCNISVPR